MTFAKTLRRALLSSLLLLAGGQASAGTVLFWADSTAGTDAMALALAGSSHTITTATGSADYVAQLGGDSYDLTVLMVQGSNRSRSQCTE